MQFVIGFAVALALVLGVMIVRLPFPHRANSAERLAMLVRELYHRGEEGAYAYVVYYSGPRTGGRIRIEKVVEEINRVRLLVSVPAESKDARLLSWPGAGVVHQDERSAAHALEQLFAEHLGVSLQRVFFLYYGLNASTQRVGWSP